MGYGVVEGAWGPGDLVCRPVPGDTVFARPDVTVVVALIAIARNDPRAAVVNGVACRMPALPVCFRVEGVFTERVRLYAYPVSAVL